VTSALEGIKVVDLTRMAPGPFCTMVLGDLGADVLRVEQPPQEGAAPDEKAAQRAAAFNALNRNKRSIAINLRNADGQEVLHRLVRDADVVVEGYRPGVVDRLRADYATLSAINPRIICCSISGFGQNGPMRLVPGHDINYISVGGALSLIGEDGGPPVPPMNIVADFAGGGLHAAMAIMAALLARERTGKGQYVDIAMSDGSTYLIASMISGYLQSGKVSRRGTTATSGAVPYYGAYECSDGKYLSLGCMEAHFWEPLCKAMGRDDFVPQQHDLSKHPEHFRVFREAFKTRTRDDWFDYLVNAGDIAVAKILEIDDMPDDPQVQARNLIMEVGSVNGETVRHVGFGPKLSDTPASVRSLGVVTGQNTDEVLSGLGYSGAQALSLRQQGAVA
jgi:crotonobetainyl-CoA:carnitine CoA-transferase CaiB-like acyl-CoA transferase